MYSLATSFQVVSRAADSGLAFRAARARWAGWLWLLALLVGLASGAAGDEVLSGPQTGGIDLRDVQHIEAGYKIFSGLCAGYCHGPEGTAKRGPAVRNRPELKAHTLFYTISNGRRRSGNPMPPWKGLLTETQIWQVVAYIVSLRDAPAVGEGSK